MISAHSLEDAVRRLATQSDVVGRLAQDSGGFAAVVAAFESKDPQAFRWVLERLGYLPHCELICEWVRVKLSVLRCMEVCLLREEKEPPTLQQFAAAVVKLGSDENRLRRAVDAVSCGNAEGFRAVIAELQLKELCYLICRWISTIIYRRICEVVCLAEPVLLGDPAHEMQASAEAIASLIGNKKAFDAIGKAAVEFNCETLRSSIQQAGFGPFCEIICRLICSWRCSLVCRELCELSVQAPSGLAGVEEARSFALAARPLADQPRVLGDLVRAVQNRNVRMYGEIIARFSLGPYCEQVCAWVCSITCFELCYCVCPPKALAPLFYAGGKFRNLW